MLDIQCAALFAPPYVCIFLSFPCSRWAIQVTGIPGNLQARLTWKIEPPQVLQAPHFWVLGFCQVSLWYSRSFQSTATWLLITVTEPLSFSPIGSQLPQLALQHNKICLLQKSLFVSPFIQNCFIILILYTVIFALSLRLPKLLYFFFFVVELVSLAQIYLCSMPIAQPECKHYVITSFVSLPPFFKQCEPYPSGALHAQSDSVQRDIWCAIISVIQKS